MLICPAFAKATAGKVVTVFAGTASVGKAGDPGHFQLDSFDHQRRGEISDILIDTNIVDWPARSGQNCRLLHQSS